MINIPSEIFPNKWSIIFAVCDARRNSFALKMRTCMEVGGYPSLWAYFMKPMVSMIPELLRLNKEISKTMGTNNSYGFIGPSIITGSIKLMCLTVTLP